MENQKLRKQNKIWISINYLSLITGILLFYIVKNHHMPLTILWFEVGIIAVLLVSFYKAFIITKFWKMVHTSSKDLDEREMQVVLNALRYAYSIFAIICIIIIYAFAIAENQPIDVVLAGGLLYFAHILPVGIVGWNEKNN
ncbi:MAG: hypothetical protein DRI95_15800 [Bacteroidetes bacterium]|nr:MAG: hypothetical protein DRI95_15800 [Bacteroidota bacterium]RLD79733.1 MAG: hypothetical protein DRJ07_11330 [Bacteroidota bacterium]